MMKQEHAQFAIYDAEAAIPRYQRAWVWGVAALVILLCGIAAGWLCGGAVTVSSKGATSNDMPALDGTVPLARQEEINRRLRERVSQLEQALNGDACGPAALDALMAGTRQP